jgi:ADP-dependent NAD(P)H-hydrate dehydratase
LLFLFREIRGQIKGFGTMKRVKTLSKLPPRKTDAHKGDFGRVLVVGGSRGMVGAPALAGLAALRGGAGLVTLAVPDRIQQTVAGLCPCATSISLKTNDDEWTPQAIRQIRQAAEQVDVLAVGPGLGIGPDKEQLLRSILELPKPVVLDADGLNNLARIDNWPALRRCEMILTPHPGEFARLTNSTTSDAQSNRESLAAEAITKWNQQSDAPPMVLVLKGAGTVVTDGDKIYVNATGNPGLATGGSGDVLTGLIAALTQQQLSFFDAACLGVYLHGLAGDLAANEKTQQGLIASDLIDFLPDAMKEFLK